jgi:adenine/guanine phosphoribosyltransferase-like PRPP-binding protein
MEYWQHFTPGPPPAPPWAETLPAVMPDGQVLPLPIRDYGTVGVGGLIANQAAFPVVHRLAAWLAESLRPFAPEVVVALPTLGQVFGPLVAERLGHTNWVAPGYTRKRWYDDALSVPLASSTGPAERLLWLDPRVAQRLEGRRVVLVDDVISTGSSALAGLALLAKAGVRPVALGVAMVQGDRWRPAWPLDVPVASAFATPLLRRVAGGWAPA